jgi:two-component system NtrC family response regulator
MSRVLIVDDDAAFRGTLAETVQSLGHEAVTAGSGEDALRRVAAADFVFLDLRMGGMDGLTLLQRIRPKHPELPVVILTAFADSANTIEAMKLGAFDHLTKPVGREDIAAVLSRALTRPRAMPATASGSAGAGELLGASPAMREVQKLVGLAAPSDATVLILGETGTGKELVARALHAHSPRAGKPFVAVNCAAIPPELLESELFGHVRGAFTGAVQPRAGRFREAAGGTLFLDEIGDMTPAMQAKVLRVLQERVVTPVGGSEALPTDVRVVAATHRDLVLMVREETFREDLYYRLNVLNILLPPLRARDSDVLLLADYFLALSAEPPKKLSAAASRALREHSWPGNVRELQNLIQKASLLVRGPVIDAGDLPLAELESGPGGLAELLKMEFHPAVARLEELLLRRALRQAAGNRAEAARLLGMRRQLLYAKLKEHGL